MFLRLPDLSLASTIPCPNCALPIDLLGSRALYCSDLCSQVARAVRYIRNCERDGRLQDPDVVEGLHTLLAFIPTGGYPARDRRIDVATREAVLERDGHRCQRCGSVGTEIDHIATSSSDLSNLQLLCHDCHMTKTQAGFKPASPEVVKPIFDPIFARAALEPAQQPSDSSDWQHTQWKRNAQHVPEVLRNWWASGIRYMVQDVEQDEDGLPPVSSPLIASEGFQETWEPWRWYEGR